MSDIMKRARANVSKVGGSELKAMANDEGLREMFAQKQALIAEMNAARRRAAEEAAAPYLEAISEIDQMYAMLLLMVGDNKE